MRERLKNIYFQVSKYICIHTINAVPFYYLWHGAIRQNNDKTLLIEKIFAYSHSKIAISFNILLVLMICPETYIFRSQITSAYIYTTIKTKDVCLCVMFMQATFPLMDQLHILHNHRSWPWGGQWLFKFKSNHNQTKNRQNAKQYMWDCSINLWNRKHTNSDTVVGFEN